MTPIVQLKDVSKLYGAVTAVDDISLEVMEGEFFTLLGPSGCGKTTTLRLIAGFLRPDRGDIMIKGRRINERPPYSRNLGVVFQNYALFPHMTVFDNVAYGLRCRRVADGPIRSKVEGALELVGLKGFGGRHPSQLSGGQQQRVALARAIVIAPDVLLLDEPLSNLDLKLRQKMRKELKTIQKEVGITTIYVTHDQGEALAMSDRIAVMNSGRLVQLGRAREIYASPKERFVAEFIGETNIMSGRVMDADDTFAVVKVHEGLVLNVHRTVGTVVGREVAVSVRPEVVGLSRGSLPDTNDAKESRDFVGHGTISNIEYLGSLTRYSVDLGRDLNVIAEVQNDDRSQDYQLGDTVLVSWSAGTTNVISNSTNKD